VTEAADAGAHGEQADHEPEPFSVQLERWLKTDEPKTVGDLGEVFAEKSFAVTILLLMFVPALPLPTGGITHVFEAITVIVAGQMVIGRRTLWLPGFAQRRELGAAMMEKALPFIVRRIRWFERFSRPRGTWVFEQRLSRSVIGLVIVAFAVGAALAPPFSGLDTMPSMGAVIIALAIILEDVVVLAFGFALGTAGILVAVTLGAAAVRLIRSIF
jgi:hypothetical protein